MAVNPCALKVNFHSISLPEMPEEPKKIFAQERVVTVTRDGNTFIEKSVVGDYTFEMPNKLNEVVEWKDREVDPVFHVKVRNAV